MKYQDAPFAYVIPEATRRKLRDECDPAPDVEISDLNPGANRVRGGVWNEDILPAVEWEAVEHRVVLPVSLQVALNMEEPVLGWRQSKYEQVREDHSQPIERQITGDPSRYLKDWRYAGAQAGKSEIWRIFFQSNENWCMAVIGRDREKSMNFITVYSPSDARYLSNMISKGDYLRREDST